MAEGAAKRASSAQSYQPVKELKPTTIISGISPTELNRLFIEQQQLYNQYVPLKIDCYGPPLRLMDYYDCFKVFQGPTVGVASGQADSLNITGHFQFHSGLIVKKTLEEDVTTDGTKVNGIHVTLDDYVDLLEPFRRSSKLKIKGDRDGWKIDEDQSPPPPRDLFSWGKSPESPESRELLRTDGFVKIVKAGQPPSTVRFHQLLMDNIDVFQSFQNKVNIVTGHNLSPALIDEYSLLFIHKLLTEPYSGDRNERLNAIVKKLNETNERLVEFTKKQILDDIASFSGLNPTEFLSPDLRGVDATTKPPKSLFTILVEQLSSKPTFWSMGDRFLSGGFSCVETTGGDTYKWDEAQTMITDQDERKLWESLAFTLTFRVDMVFKGEKYFFSLILDRETFNRKLKGKGVFKQYEIYKDILHDSFKGCIVDALRGFATATATAAEATATAAEATAAIEQLWSERTFDLIQNGCAEIERCITPDNSSQSSRLKLVFHTKKPNGDITLLPNPFDTNPDWSKICGDVCKMDPVVNVHLHFPKIRNVIKDHLSVPPGGSEIVDWSKTVNDYDEGIIDELLAKSQGRDWQTASLLGSHSQSQSVGNMSNFTVSSTPGTAPTSPRSATSSQERSVSPGRPITESAVRGIERVSIDERISDFWRSHEKDAGNSTQNPPDDCAAQPGHAPRVGFFTQFRTALVELVKTLFKRPESEFDWGGGGSLHKKPRRSKTRTRRNKKYSRKKARHYNTYVKTRIKRRRSATYKK